MGAPSASAGGSTPINDDTAKIPVQAEAARHPVGRPSTRTPEVVELILELIFGGNSDRTASEIAEIEYPTFRRWLAEDAEFRSRVNRARAQRKRRLIERMVLGAEGEDPAWNNARLQTALAILRAHEPETWTDKAKIEHSGNVGIFQAAAATLKDRDKPEDEISGE